MNDKNEGTGAGATTGFQLPLSIKKRKSHLDEMLKTNTDIDEGHVLSFLDGIDEQLGEDIGKCLESGMHSEIAEQVRLHAIRELVRTKISEVVRKNPEGGGFILFAPNKGKKKDAKPAGKFPTKLSAKRAELARYPPKDTKKLQRLRREVDRLMKDPKKRIEKEKQAMAPKKESAAVLPDGSGFFTAEIQTESVKRRKDHMHRMIISKIIKEGLFKEDTEEGTTSQWDEFIQKLSTRALASDGKFQKLQQKIEKQTEKILTDAFASVKKNVDKNVKLKNLGVKRNEQLKKVYLAFSADIDGVDVGPIYIHSENGIPKIDVSSEAKASLTKADPDMGKSFRAELISVQETILDNEQDLIDAIRSRDSYLKKIESEVDSYIAGLGPVQISMLKNLLVKKYRGTVK